MKNLCTALLAAAIALVLQGCLGGSGNATFSDGYYRFVHISPGSDNLAIASNGTQIVPSLSYHSATPYLEFGWGTPQIKVTSATSGVTYVNATIPVGSDGHYTYFLFGGGASVTNYSLRDDVVDAPSGSFLLREIHLATGIGAVDFYLLAAGATVDAGTPITTANAYGIGTVFTPYTAGTYHLAVTPTGTKTVIYDSGNQVFTNNEKVSFVIFATGSGQLVNAALLPNDSTGTTNFVDNPASRMKVVSATTDVPVVDVLVDGTVTLADVPYGGVADYAQVAAGTRNLAIQPSSTPGAYVYNQNQTLSAGYDQSFASFSIQGTGSAGLIALQDNNLPPPSGRAKLRIVNAGSDATAYDAYANTTKLVSNLVQGSASAYQVLAPATYALAFNPTGTSTAATLLNASLVAGHVYTVYTFGRSGAVASVLTTDY